jgi:hypothetical protein
VASEGPMAATATAKDFAQIFTPPPSFDWAMLTVGDDVKQLEKAIDLFETQAVEWRASTFTKMQSLQQGLEQVELAISPELLEQAIKAVEETIVTFSAPMHSDPEMAVKIDQLSKLSTSVGKFVRKLMRRIEKIRVAQHAALIDMYYGLLALRSELEGKDNEPRESFSDPAALGAFLRRQIA